MKRLDIIEGCPLRVNHNTHVEDFILVGSPIDIRVAIGSHVLILFTTKEKSQSAHNLPHSEIVLAKFQSSTASELQEKQRSNDLVSLLRVADLDRKQPG